MQAQVQSQSPSQSQGPGQSRQEKEQQATIQLERAKVPQLSREAAGTICRRILPALNLNELKLLPVIPSHRPNLWRSP